MVKDELTNEELIDLAMDRCIRPSQPGCYRCCVQGICHNDTLVKYLLAKRLKDTDNLVMEIRKEMRKK